MKKVDQVFKMLDFSLDVTWVAAREIAKHLLAVKKVGLEVNVDVSKYMLICRHLTTGTRL
jgi:hypothetical protein